MKKLFGIIAIALLFSFAGMQEVYADEWEIKVTWEDHCNDCDEFTAHDYVVCLSIWDKCKSTELLAEVCYSVSSSTFEYVFDDAAHKCLPDIAPCYEVTATVKKRCIFWQTILCQNSEMVTVNCDQISDGFEIVCDIP